MVFYRWLLVWQIGELVVRRSVFVVAMQMRILLMHYFSVFIRCFETLAVVLWQLWNERNHAKHGLQCLGPSEGRESGICRWGVLELAQWLDMVVDLLAKRFPCLVEPFVAELMAIRKALSCCRTKGVHIWEVESDCLSAVSAVTSLADHP
ncbi:hypothetical protein PanWU01x14_014070 [Parasponia andersonii]|uniref:RNase H type-1 domain-containing protein n=1 Tax=Parasponia andersonii TaxID=3476 RepID=A0A2P5E170_PARAD|nr:hypothetical protein PanWU01x14_014070 [Parasponia andersonii]